MVEKRFHTPFHPIIYIINRMYKIHYIFSAILGTNKYGFLSIASFTNKGMPHCRTKANICFGVRMVVLWVNPASVSSASSDACPFMARRNDFYCRAVVLIIGKIGYSDFCNGVAALQHPFKTLFFHFICFLINDAAKLGRKIGEGKTGGKG